MPNPRPSQLTTYLRLASRRPLLTADEERRLGTLIQAGREATARLDAGIAVPGDRQAAAAGREARMVLVESNLRLVVSIARRFPTHTLADLADLVQAGNEGLLAAAEGFDPSRGFRFSTYATTWIRSRIGRTIDKTTAALHMPIDSVNALRGALRNADGGADAMPAELLELELAYAAASLDVPIADGSTPLGDLRPATHSVEEAVVRRLDEELAHGLLRRVPEPHRSAVALHLGFRSGRPESNRAVALALGISSRRSRFLVRDGLRMLAEVAGAPRPDADRHEDALL